MKILAFTKVISPTMDANHQDATNPEIALQNPFDTAPLTTAQNLKKQVGTTLATLCMGTNDIAYTTACLQQITHLYDIDHTYLLHDPFLAGSDTLATAYALSATSKFLGDFDLYLCGAQSSDGATGQVGIEIAAHLGLSVLCNVCKIEVIDAQKIKCTVLSQFGRYVFVATLPCVLCMVGTKGSSNVQPINVTQYTDTPPFAGTLLTALQANLDLSKIGLQGSPTQIKSTSKIESAQKNEFKLTSLQPKKAIDITQEYLTILPQILQKTKQERTTILKHNHHRPTRKISHSDSVWIFCEQVCNHIIPECYQIISKACQLAKPHGGEVIALCSHKPLKQDRALLSEYGVDRCLHGDFEKHTDCLFDQKMVDWFVDLCKTNNPHQILLGCTVFGNFLASTIAVRLQTGLCTDCVDLTLHPSTTHPTQSLLCTRTALGGTRLDKMASNTLPQIATVRANTFALSQPSTALQKPCKMLLYPSSNLAAHKQITQTAFVLSPPQIPLSSADIVLAGGRGILKNNGLQKLKLLAQKMGAAVAVSRPLVDEGRCDRTMQVGGSGHTIAPKLYIAFGIYGAKEHIVGMHKASTVISIDTDKYTPMILFSDYKITQDAVSVLDKLLKYI